RVLADAARLRRVVGPVAGALGRAGVLGGRHEELRELAHPGVDQDLVLLVLADLVLEEPERLADANAGRAEGHPAPLPVDAARAPGGPLAGQRDHPPGMVV